MKTVELKILVEVQDETTYVAVDSDGEIFGFSNKPELIWPVYSSADGFWFDRCFTKGMKLPPVNWRETLTEVK